MKILCWNVAGIRALIRKQGLNFLTTTDFDIICFQETKALESQVDISEELKTQFPFRAWGENHGKTQRKGLSGTAIWSKTKPIRRIEPMSLDTEGRITALEFKDYNVVTVYTPNSQGPDSDRCQFRTELWDAEFGTFIAYLNRVKPTIVCGDFNVAHLEADIYSPDKHRNCCAGFLDIERYNFSAHLSQGFVDAFREKYPDVVDKYTYWDQIRKHMRIENRGWRIDYFLVPQKEKANIMDCQIHPDIMGSDHCPISLEMRDLPNKINKLKILE